MSAGEMDILEWLLDITQAAAGGCLSSFNVLPLTIPSYLNSPHLLVLYSLPRRLVFLLSSYLLPLISYLLRLFLSCILPAFMGK